MADPVKSLKFIGCEVIYREACRLASTSPHRVDVEFLHKGLHDLQRGDMLAKIQSAVDAASAAEKYDAILLGYARCNDGLAGLQARSIPLVIPRAHDCITFFFGSRKAYKDYFDAHPGTYFLTSGWIERGDSNFENAQPAYGQTGVMGKLGLTESYEQLVAKYGQENADFIAETLGDWRKNYRNLLYIEMGVCDERRLIEQAGCQAKENDWSFERRRGDLSLLEKFFQGVWDHDFLVVAPSEHIVARNDDAIIGVER